MQQLAQIKPENLYQFLCFRFWDDRGLDESYMEATGNESIDLNSQFRTIVATHPHLQLDRNSIPSPLISLNFAVHP